MPLAPLPLFLIQVQNPYMEFGLMIQNIMEGEVLFHLRDPPYWVGSIKFMHVNFGHLIPIVWRTPRGVGQMSMLIMGMLRVLCIGLDLLTFCELLHGLMDGYFDFYLEGLFDFDSYGSADGFHFCF
uniref:Uncharacterized protein n=1 Tax=Picea sitchensis TaxID=3332 RepID=D5ABV3_PICSI|nr:unknown [Picea sitchensis]